MSNSVEFMINIQQKLTGDNAVTELQKLERQIKGEEGALRSLEAWMRRIQKTNAVDIATYRHVSAAITQKRDRVAALSLALAKAHDASQDVNDDNDALGNATKKAGGAFSLFMTRVGDTGDALAKFGGPLGTASGGTLQLADAFQKMAALGPAGIVAVIAVAVVALAAALGYAVLSMARFALASANARRDTALTVEGLLENGAAARALAADMGRIERATGVAAERQLDLVRQLKDAKVPAEQMGRALRALSTAEAAGAPEAIADFVKELKSGATTVDELARAVDKRFGAIAAKRMLGLDQQAQRFERNLAGLFDGIDPEPFLKALHELLGLFDESSATGRTLRYLLTSLFQPLLDSSGVVFPIVKRFLQGLIIAALHLYIAVKPIVRAVLELFNIKPGDGMESALWLGQAAFWALAATVAIVAASLLLALSPVVVLLGVIALVALALAAPFIIVGFAVYGLVSAVQDLWKYMMGLDWGAIASHIIDGLANGISSRVGRVIAAVRGMGKSMLGALDSVLEINSPSRAFHRRGGLSADGVVDGVEDGTPDVESAVSRMVAVPDQAEAPRARGGGTGGGRGADLSGATFNFYGVRDAEHAVEWFEAKLAALLEGKAAELGAELEPV